MAKKEYTIEETRANLDHWRGQLAIAQKKVQFLDKIVTDHDIKLLREKVRKEFEKERDGKKGA